MSPQRAKIEWEPNVPISVQLEYDGGKEVAGRNGPQYLYWLDLNRSMFLDPEPHQMIQQSGAKAGDTIEITRTQRGKQLGWEVVHVIDEPNAYPTDPHTMARRELASQPASQQPDRSARTPFKRSGPTAGTASSPHHHHRNSAVSGGIPRHH